MTSLKLTEGGDIAIENNSLQIISDSEEVAQKIKTVLKTIRGECFLDTTKGIPYITDVVGKNRNLNLIADLIKNEVLSIEEVDSLDSFSIELGDNRSLLIKFKVNGNIEIETVL